MKPVIAKITLPRAQGVVERHRLFELMNRAAGKKIILISAPVGSGKTMLVANWIEVRKILCLWYQADESDRDSASFFSCLGERSNCSYQCTENRNIRPENLYSPTQR